MVDQDSSLIDSSNIFEGYEKVSGKDQDEIKIRDLSIAKYEKELVKNPFMDLWMFQKYPDPEHRYLTYLIQLGISKKVIRNIQHRIEINKDIEDLRAFEKLRRGNIAKDGKEA